jgi:subtilisin-like proprotein convertase family protein
MPIADGHPIKGPGITESDITPGSSILAVSVEVTLTHEDTNELTMWLLPPDSDPIELTPVSNGTATYDIEDVSGTGTWALRIEDSAKGNRGTLESWTLFAAAGASAPLELLAADLYFSDLVDSSDEEHEGILEPEIAELLLYDL